MNAFLTRFEDIFLILWTAAILCAVVQKYPALYSTILFVGGASGIVLSLTRIYSHGDGRQVFFDLLGMIAGVFFIVLAAEKYFGH